MKIISVSIENFRSIHKIEGLGIEAALTTFVGGNEHGKSNLLQALTFLNPNITFDTAKDFRMTNNGEQLPSSLTFIFALDSAERKNVLASLTEAYPAETVTEPDGTVTTKKPEKSFKLSDVPEQIKFNRNYADGKSYYSFPDIADVDMRNHLYAFLKSNAAQKIIYFDEFTDRLEAVISKEEVEDAENHPIVAGLLKVGGLKGKESTIFSDDTATRVAFDRAPQRITKAINDSWYQGSVDKIKVKLSKSIAGESLMVEIEDQNTYVAVDARSRGFKWFISFFLKYRAHHDGDLKNAIFIIDEPGLFLHPRGQKDLLRYLAVLSKTNQIVYSTHSPFMIDRLKPTAVRVVERDPGAGTKINSKGFTANWRHLRTSLGMVLADSFYFADNSLLVEGAEDRIYITSLLSYLAARGQISIDVNLMSILDAGGATEMPSMARIVKDEQRPLIALLDSDVPASFAKVKKVLGEKFVKEVKEFDASSTTIQDLLPREEYVAAVNRYVDNLVADSYLTLIEGKPKHFTASSGQPIDKQVEAFIKDSYGEDEISKVGVAREFDQGLNSGETKTDLDRSKKLIDWIVKELDLTI